MNGSVVGTIVLACTFGGALIGVWLRKALPSHHLDNDSRDTIKVGIGLIATMTALLLGLVTASAKSSFDTMDTAVKQTAIQILTLDRLLARYGPETNEIRQGLKQGVGARIDMIWPHDSAKPVSVNPMPSGSAPMAERLTDAIRSLKAKDDAQRALQSRAVDTAESLLQARWMALVGAENSIPLPFLVILVFWLTIVFVSFGLFAPRNATVIAALFVCSVSVAAALFLVLEMESPLTGFIQVSPDALRYALSSLGK
jgi:hypothetical protein